MYNTCVSLTPVLSVSVMKATCACVSHTKCVHGVLIQVYFYLPM